MHELPSSCTYDAPPIYSYERMQLTTHAPLHSIVRWCASQPSTTHDMTCVPRIAFNHARQTHGSKCAATTGVFHDDSTPRTTSHGKRVQSSPTRTAALRQAARFCCAASAAPPHGPTPLFSFLAFFASRARWSGVSGFFASACRRWRASEVRRIWSRTATKGNLGGRVHICGAGKGIWVRVRAGGSKPLLELEHGPRQGRFLEGAPW